MTVSRRACPCASHVGAKKTLMHDYRILCARLAHTTSAATSVAVLVLARLGLVRVLSCIQVFGPGLVSTACLATVIDYICKRLLHAVHCISCACRRRDRSALRRSVTIAGKTTRRPMCQTCVQALDGCLGQLRSWHSCQSLIYTFSFVNVSLGAASASFSRNSASSRSCARILRSLSLFSWNKYSIWPFCCVTVFCR